MELRVSTLFFFQETEDDAAQTVFLAVETVFLLEEGADLGQAFGSGVFQKSENVPLGLVDASPLSGLDLADALFDRQTRLAEQIHGQQHLSLRVSTLVPVAEENAQDVQVLIIVQEVFELSLVEEIVADWEVLVIVG